MTKPAQDQIEDCVMDMDKEVTAALTLLSELQDQHGSLAPMILTLALVMWCDQTGQKPEVHMAFGRQWEAIQKDKTKRIKN